MLADRLALIERVKTQDSLNEDPRPAWDLINHASQYQEEANSLLEKKLRRGGQ
jgi:hypothetical protein